jgi:predicted RNase H-like HicB family nuclease
MGEALRKETDAMKWRVLLERDEETGEWAAWCPELPGCASAGETEAEALENIREAIELYLQSDPLELSPDVITREVLV